MTAPDHLEALRIAAQRAGRGSRLKAQQRLRDALHQQLRRDVKQAKRRQKIEARNDQ